MDKQAFEELLQSVAWMQRHKAGKTRSGRVSRVVAPDVKRVRSQSGLPQAEFARLIGVSTRTLQNWEQGHRRPTGPAAALLRAVKANPRAVIRALHGQG